MSLTCDSTWFKSTRIKGEVVSASCIDEIRDMSCLSVQEAAFSSDMFHVHFSPFMNDGEAETFY